MDFQFWIWLIVIVITLIARANKKKPGQAPPADELPDFSGDSQPSRQPKPVTFEDLLREIQGEKQRAAKPPQPAPKVEEKKYDFVDYDDDIPDEIQDLEDVDYDFSRDEEVFKKYEEAKKEASEPISRKSKGVGQIVRSEHFKEYNLGKRKATSFDFIAELKDPKGFKKAFIMSEILNKKY